MWTPSQPTAQRWQCRPIGGSIVRTWVEESGRLGTRTSPFASESMIRAAWSALRELCMQARCGRAIQFTSVVFVLLSLSSSALAQNQCGLKSLFVSGDFYPQIARAAHMSGDVALMASFDHDGKPTAARVVAGATILGAAAKNLLKSSLASPSNDVRECPVTVSFELMAPKWGDNCELLNSGDGRIELRDPTSVKISSVETNGCVLSVVNDPVHIRHQFLFFHWYSKV
jgi:hypothetical protein